MDVAYKRRFSIGVPKGRRSGSWFDAEYWPEGHPGGHRSDTSEWWAGAVWHVEMNEKWWFNFRLVRKVEALACNGYEP